MARKVVWAYAAEEDLDAAAAYIHRDSPAYAASFLNRALQTGRSLSELAERGRMVPTGIQRQRHPRDFRI